MSTKSCSCVMMARPLGHFYKSDNYKFRDKGNSLKKNNMNPRFKWWPKRAVKLDEFLLAVTDGAWKNISTNMGQNKPGSAVWEKWPWDGIYYSFSFCSHLYATETINQIPQRFTFVSLSICGRAKWKESPPVPVPSNEWDLAFSVVLHCWRLKLYPQQKLNTET